MKPTPPWSMQGASESTPMIFSQGFISHIDMLKSWRKVERPTSKCWMLWNWANFVPSHIPSMFLTSHITNMELTSLTSHTPIMKFTSRTSLSSHHWHHMYGNKSDNDWHRLRSPYSMGISACQYVDIIPMTSGMFSMISIYGRKL